MKIHNVEQRSTAWRALRLGRPTASQFDRIITPAGKPSREAKRYMAELIHERIFVQPWLRVTKTTKAMEDGIEREPWARKQFQLETGLEVVEIGFVTPDHGRFGCSPDGLVLGRDEIVEIKCPTGPVHIQYLIYGPEEAYYAQVQGALLIGNWDRCHFYSYHEEMAAKHASIGRDPGFISALNMLLLKFCDELDVAERYVRQLGVWPKNLPSEFPDPEPEEAV